MYTVDRAVDTVEISNSSKEGFSFEEEMLVDPLTIRQKLRRN